jgi:dipeptidyl aminopeptidase/acylaminoacyl peptidase
VNKHCSFLGASAAVLWCALQAVAQTPTPHTAIPLDPAAADRYEGYYQMGPQRAVHFWREGDHFYFGAVGMAQRMEAFPETPTRFFFANPAITFTFNAGTDGKVTGLTINQAGRDIAAPRIEEVLAKSFPAPGSAAAARPAVPRTWPMMAAAAPRQITARTAGVIDYWPCFSPDGKTVLFSRTVDGGKTWSLFRVSAAGGAAELFAKLPVSATRASWSAKSGRIVFNGDAAGAAAGGIWVMDGNGRNAHAIATDGILAPSYPSWYPDGRTIGFGDAARNILYRMDTAGKPVAVTHQEQVLTGMSSVAPDGQWVAFAGQKNNGQIYQQNDNQIWLVDDSGQARTLETQPLQGRTPSWSPDGRRVAFESDRGSPSGLYAVFIVNREGTGLVQVTDYALNAGHPVFSPDGRRLVFAVGDPAQGISALAVLTLADKPPPG